jgi:hypothetical protein
MSAADPGGSRHLDFGAGLLSDPGQRLTQQLSESEQQLRERSSAEVEVSRALISLGEFPIIKKGTINLLQGKYGTHKSRILETFASLLLSAHDSPQHFLGFSLERFYRLAVVYIDTERNTKEEFPLSIQRIRRGAGYPEQCDLPGFRFNSIKQIERKDRLGALKMYIAQVSGDLAGHHLVVFLDVVTDCVSSFNDVGESLELMDFLGNLTEQHDITFLLSIHENYGSDKARGHTGSEAINKASAAMQIGFEKRNNEDTDVIKLKFVKLRHYRKPDPLYLQYAEPEKRLVVIDGQMLKAVLPDADGVAPLDQVVTRLENILVHGTSRRDLYDRLTAAFNCSENTIEGRLRRIMADRLVLHDRSGQPCRLARRSSPGRITSFMLEPIDAPPPTQPNQ